jgi:hypothetical protein
VKLTLNEKVALLSSPESEGLVQKKPDQNSTPGLMRLPVELRLEILKQLLPDVSVIPFKRLIRASDPEPGSNGRKIHCICKESMCPCKALAIREKYRTSLRRDGAPCYTQCMRVNRILYEEAHDMIYKPIEKRLFEMTLSPPVSDLTNSSNRHLASTCKMRFCDETWRVGASPNPELARRLQSPYGLRVLVASNFKYVGLNRDPIDTWAEYLVRHLMPATNLMFLEIRFEVFVEQRAGYSFVFDMPDVSARYGIWRRALRHFEVLSSRESTVSKSLREVKVLFLDQNGSVYTAKDFTQANWLFTKHAEDFALFVDSFELGLCTESGE